MTPIYNKTDLPPGHHYIDGDRVFIPEGYKGVTFGRVKPGDVHPKGLPLVIGLLIKEQTKVVYRKT